MSESNGEAGSNAMKTRWRGKQTLSSGVERLGQSYHRLSHSHPPRHPHPPRHFQTQTQCGEDEDEDEDDEEPDEPEATNMVLNEIK